MESLKFFRFFIEWMDDRERYEGVLELVRQIADGNLLVIVEGKRDKKALEWLGVKRILLLESYYKTVERVEGENEVVLLVDLDSEGKKIYGWLKEELARHHVKVNDALREFLFRNTGVRQIEGLDSYLERLKRKF